MDTIITAAMPYVLELIAFVVAGIIAWGTRKAREKWGIEIEARHREALQSAIMTGARLALARQMTGAAAIQIILDHVRSVGAPDAVSHFDLRAEALSNLAMAKFEQVAAEKMRGVTTVSVSAMADALQDRALRRG